LTFLKFITTLFSWLAFYASLVLVFALSYEIWLRSESVLGAIQITAVLWIVYSAIVVFVASIVGDLRGEVKSNA